MNLGFWGAPASPGFVPAERTDSRPIKIGGQDRAPFLGRQAAHAGVGGRRRGGPIFSLWAACIVMIFIVFLFLISFFNTVLNGFGYNLVSIHICTNVYII